MLDYKGALQSLTIWAGAIVTILGFFGIVTNEADISQIAEYTDAIIQAVMGILVIVGRIRANSEIRGLL